MRRLLTAVVLLSLPACPVRAQMDPDRRLFLAAGYEQGLGAPGPAFPYAYLYSNEPGALGPRTALRVVAAPVYADVELAVKDALPRTDLGLGISGGGYAFGQVEVDRGIERRGESFLGHGGGPSLSLYPKLGTVGPAPLSGVVRMALSRLSYGKVEGTDGNFTVPRDQWNSSFRAGLRLGGQAPGLESGPAAEASAWWETRLRERAGGYGYSGDRMLERRVDLYWMRLLISLPVAGRSTVAGGVSLGGGNGVDRLAAYRLGGLLTQTSEFPLILPGYFGQEVSARRFTHAWGRLAAPLQRFPSLSVLTYAGAATAAAAPGTDAGATLHAGLGAGLAWSPVGGRYAAELGWGYSPTARRGSRSGAHTIALSFQLDYLAGKDGRRSAPAGQNGLRWLIGHWLTSPFRK